MSRVMELAKKCGLDLYSTDLLALESFYQAAYRDGQEDMRDRCAALAHKDELVWYERLIRALEIK